jgi:hypothetical protein
MNTPDKKAKEDQDALLKKCGYKVARVQNNSSFNGIGDGLQVAGQEQGNIDITSIRTALMLREGLKNRSEIYVIAHSQGTKVFEQAIALLTPQERSKIKFQGFGGEQYIDQKKYGLASARNVRHVKDPIPKVNDARLGKQNWEPITTMPKVEKGKEPSLFDYHTFLKAYLDSVELPTNPDINTPIMRKEDE